jgi:RNA polymerase sigma factor (sigma-70 family)
MGDHDLDSSRSSVGVRPFPSTHWSVVLTACATSPDGEAALTEVCRKYWRPLYAFVRRRGYGPEDAEDLTQEFLARFIEKRYLGLADPRRGRFRCFFLTALQHFLNDEWDRAHAAKRGGGRKVISLDLPLSGRWIEPADNLTPEKVYDRCWGEALLAAVLDRLTEEYAASGKTAQFEELKRFLWGGDGSITYARIAQRLDMTEDAVKSAVRRLRARYSQLLRHEISQTVASREEFEEELRWLRATFASNG